MRFRFSMTILFVTLNSRSFSFLLVMWPLLPICCLLLTLFSFSHYFLKITHFKHVSTVGQNGWKSSLSLSSFVWIICVMPHASCHHLPLCSRLMNALSSTCLRDLSSSLPLWSSQEHVRSDWWCFLTWLAFPGHAALSCCWLTDDLNRGKVLLDILISLSARVWALQNFQKLL